MKTEAGIRVMWPQAKDAGAPWSSEAREGFPSLSPELPGGLTLPAPGLKATGP